VRKVERLVNWATAGLDILHYRRELGCTKRDEVVYGVKGGYW